RASGKGGGEAEAAVRRVRVEGEGLLTAECDDAPAHVALESEVRGARREALERERERVRGQQRELDAEGALLALAAHLGRLGEVVQQQVHCRALLLLEAAEHAASSSRGARTRAALRAHRES